MAQCDNQGVPTWRDFPEFYENPFVKALAGNEKWTVSDKNKRPIDMRALIEQGKIWGAAWNRGYNPLVDLDTVCRTIPSAVNNAYFLDALEDKFVVMDIEPSCPEHLKTQFMSLPYVYGETSMSGKGIHLVFPLPGELLDRYPVAKQKQALKAETGYYEILLNHMVTFTRNVLPVPANPNGTASFENVFEILAMRAKETSHAKGTVIDADTDIDDIPHGKTLLTVLRGCDFKKTQKDFINKKSGKQDTSAFEFGTAGFYFAMLSRMLLHREYKGHVYSDDECARLIYEVLKEKLPYRPKHDEARYGMPWLCFIATDIVAKNSDPNNPMSLKNMHKKPTGKKEGE